MIAWTAAVETIPEVTLSHWDNISALWTFVVVLGPCGLEEPSAGPKRDKDLEQTSFTVIQYDKNHLQQWARLKTPH